MKEKGQQTGVLPSYFLPDLWLMAGWHTFSVHGQIVHMLGFARYRVSVTTVRSAITSKRNPCAVSGWREVAGLLSLQNWWWPEFGLQGVVCWLQVYGINFEFGKLKFFYSSTVSISDFQSQLWMICLFFPRHFFYCNVCSWININYCVKKEGISQKGITSTKSALSDSRKVSCSLC